MKCYQERNEFKPIILTIDEYKEAQIFFDVIDKINKIDFVFTKEEKDMIIELSNFVDDVIL